MDEFCSIFCYLHKIWFLLDHSSSCLFPVTQTAVPITPGGVQISALTLTGDDVSPMLLEEEEEDSSGDSFGPIPRLAVSTFQITYTVVNCGVRLTLIEGDQSDSSSVITKLVQAGTPGVTGTFDLSFQGREIRGVPADIASDRLEGLLETNLPDEGGKAVQQCEKEL